jgi:hypothetical protein
MDPQINGWLAASWPVANNPQLGRGFFLVEGYGPASFTFTASSSCGAMYGALKILLNWSKAHSQPLRVHVCLESMLRATALKPCLDVCGSSLVWIPSAKLNSHLGHAFTKGPVGRHWRTAVAQTEEQWLNSETRLVI